MSNKQPKLLGLEPPAPLLPAGWAVQRLPDVGPRILAPTAFTTATWATHPQDTALRIVSEPDEVRPCTLSLRTADQELVLSASEVRRLEELQQVGAWVAHHTGWPITLK